MSLNPLFFASEDDRRRIDFDHGPLAGEWIMIRGSISHADNQRLLGAMFTGMREEPTEDGGTRRHLEADATTLDLRTMRFWLVRWSLEGGGDQGRRPTDDALRALLPPHAAQILQAIKAHADALDAEAEVESDPLGPSANGAGRAGASSTRARAGSGKPSTSPTN